MSLSPEDREEIRAIAQAAVGEGGFVASLFKGASEVEREQIANDISRFMFDRQIALREPENTYTPVWRNENRDINYTSPTEFYKENVAGFAGPTLPRAVNLRGANWETWLSANDPQELNLRLRASGGNDCMFTHIASSCWATEIANSRGVEGQSFTSLTGCTFKVYSAVTLALAAISTEMTADSTVDLALLICHGVYTESPTFDASNNCGSLLIVGSGQQTTEIIGNFTHGATITSGRYLTMRDLTISGDFIIGASGLGDNVQAANLSVTGVLGDTASTSVANHRYTDCTFGSVEWGGNCSNLWFEDCQTGDFTVSVSGTTTNLRWMGGLITGSVVLNPCDDVLFDTRWSGVGTPGYHVFADGSGSRGLTLRGHMNALSGSSAAKDYIRIDGGATLPRDFDIDVTCEIASSTTNAVHYVNSIGNALKASRIRISGGASQGSTNILEDLTGAHSSIVGAFTDCNIICTPGRSEVEITSGSNNMVNGAIWVAGAPTLSANEGTLAYDTTNNTYYMNTSALYGSTWSILGVAGGGGAAPSPHDFVGTHHTGDDNYTQTPGVLGLGFSTGDLTGYSDAGITPTAFIDGGTGQIVSGDDLDGATITFGGTPTSARIAARNDGVGNPLGLLFTQHSSTSPTTLGPFITLAKSRGTYGAQLIVQDNNVLGVIDFLGHDGVDYERAAQIRAEVDGTPGSGDMPGRLEFHVTPDGSASPAEAFRVVNTGGIWIASYVRVGSIAVPTNATAGDLTATRLIVPNATILHSAITQLGGPVVIPGDGTLLFSDNTNYVGLQAPATPQTENYIYQLPDDDPVNGQVLAVKSTAGSPTISTEWIAAGGAATIAVEEGNVEVAADITRLDFGTGFDITAAAGEAEITLDVSEINITQTLVLTAGGGYPTITSGCAVPTLVDSGDQDINVWVLDFDATTQEFAFWTVAMPDNYNGGTVTFRVIWFTTSSTATHTAVFGLQARAYGDAETLNQAYGTAVEVSDDATATANQVLHSAVSAAVTIGGTPAGGEFVAFRLYRDPADANDDLNVDARVLAVVIEYTTAGLSS